MDQEHIHHFKELFLDMKKNYDWESNWEEVHALKAASGDDADRAWDNKNRELILKIKSREKKFIIKVDRSLERIENGSFGLCLECDDDIDLQRLYARPTADLCINCKEEQENKEGHILYENRSQTIGKEINFAKVIPLRKSDHFNPTEGRVIQLNDHQ